MSGSPVFIQQWQPGFSGQPELVPFSLLTQLVVNDSISAPFTPVYLVGDADAGCLRTSLYGSDGSKLPAQNVALAAESGGELKTSLYADYSGIRTALVCEITGESIVSIRAPDSVSGLPVAPVVVGDALKVAPTAGAPATGASINGTAAASGIIKPANAASAQVIIQNVDAAETLYVSFNDPATTDDIALQPGMSITFNAGVANDIYGLGSGAGAKYSIMELSA